MQLRTLELPDKLLDIAFSRARKQAALYPKQKTAFYTLKGKEIAKIDVSATYLIETLTQTVIEFPSVDKLPAFYREIMGFVVDINKTKIALSKMSSTSRIIKDLRRNSIVGLKELRFEQGSNVIVKQISKSYFGRVSSMIKSLKKEIEFYNNVVSKLREMPSIKTDEELYLLAGLPNVGKSTLLKKLTPAKPEIAAYPFTTKGLNVGKFFRKHMPVQVIDTPGLLDRPLSERNQIELKAISAFQHLKGTIIFVVDPTQEIKDQKNLFIELKKLFSDKGFIVVINKTDIASEEQTKETEKAFKEQFVILEGNNLDNLKKELNGDV